jgi:hypothetical protein
MIPLHENLISLFSQSVRLSGIGRIEPESSGDPRLLGKRLGLINGASWITLWCNYFGKQLLPGVKLINASNDAVQLYFTKAFREGKPCPPQESIDSFVYFSKQLVKLGEVDALLITCSTMNRSYGAVAAAVDVPVVQIDLPMMELAVQQGGKVLVVASLVTTVNSTMALLHETAQRFNRKVDCVGATVEDAWICLAEGDIVQHNQIIANAIRSAQSKGPLGCVVLAQLSMAVFSFSYPDPVKTFGVPVYNSAETGFGRVREILLGERRE